MKNFRLKNKTKIHLNSVFDKLLCICFLEIFRFANSKMIKEMSQCWRQKWDEEKFTEKSDTCSKKQKKTNFSLN